MVADPPVLLLSGIPCSGVDAVARMLQCHPDIVRTDNDGVFQLKRNATTTSSDMRLSDVVDSERLCLSELSSVLADIENIRVLLVVRKASTTIEAIMKDQWCVELATAAWILNAAVIRQLFDTYSATGKIRLVRYEVLLDNPERELRAIFDFLGVDLTQSFLQKQIGFFKGSSVQDSCRFRTAIGGFRSDDSLFGSTESVVSYEDYPALEAYFGYSSISIRIPPSTALSKVVRVGTLPTSEELFYANKVAFTGMRKRRIVRFLVRILSFTEKLAEAVSGILVQSIRACWQLAQILADRSAGISENIRPKAMASRVSGFFDRTAHFFMLTNASIVRKFSAGSDIYLGRLANKAERLRDNWLSNIGTHIRIQLPSTRNYCCVGVVVVSGHAPALAVVVEQFFRCRERGIPVGLVFSCTDESSARIAESFRNKYKDVGVVLSQGCSPGKQWQRAVDCAALASPRFLAVIGQNVVLTPRYLDRQLEIMRERRLGWIQLVKPTTWYLVDVEGSHMPIVWRVAVHDPAICSGLDSGTIYDAEFLSEVRWQIYDVRAESGLGRRGYNLIVHKGKLVYTPVMDDGFVVFAANGEGKSSRMHCPGNLKDGIGRMSFEPMGDSEVDLLAAEFQESWSELLLRGIERPVRR